MAYTLSYSNNKYMKGQLKNFTNYLSSHCYDYEEQKKRTVSWGSKIIVIIGEIEYVINYYACGTFDSINFRNVSHKKCNTLYPLIESKHDNLCVYLSSNTPNLLGKFPELYIGSTICCFEGYNNFNQLFRVLDAHFINQIFVYGQDGKLYRNIINIDNKNILIRGFFSDKNKFLNTIKIFPDITFISGTYYNLNNKYNNILFDKYTTNIYITVNSETNKNMLDIGSIDNYRIVNIYVDYTA